MKRFLLSCRVPEAAILLEPCARHSHITLRNTGRRLLSTGLRRGGFDMRF